MINPTISSSALIIQTINTGHPIMTIVQEESTLCLSILIINMLLFFSMILTTLEFQSTKSLLLCLTFLIIRVTLSNFQPQIDSISTPLFWMILKDTMPYLMKSSKMKMETSTSREIQTDTFKTTLL